MKFTGKQNFTHTLISEKLLDSNILKVKGILQIPLNEPDFALNVFFSSESDREYTENFLQNIGQIYFKNNQVKITTVNGIDTLTYFSDIAPLLTLINQSDFTIVDNYSVESYNITEQDIKLDNPVLQSIYISLDSTIADTTAIDSTTLSDVLTELKGKYSDWTAVIEVDTLETYQQKLLDKFQNYISLTIPGINWILDTNINLLFDTDSNVIKLSDNNVSLQDILDLKILDSTVSIQKISDTLIQILINYPLNTLGQITTFILTDDYIQNVFETEENLKAYYKAYYKVNYHEHTLDEIQNIYQTFVNKRVNELDKEIEIPELTVDKYRIRLSNSLSLKFNDSIKYDISLPLTFAYINSYQLSELNNVYLNRLSKLISNIQPVYHSVYYETIVIDNEQDIKEYYPFDFTVVFSNVNLFQDLSFESIEVNIEKTFSYIDGNIELIYSDSSSIDFDVSNLKNKFSSDFTLTAPFVNGYEFYVAIAVAKGTLAQIQTLLPVNELKIYWIVDTDLDKLLSDSDSSKQILKVYKIVCYQSTKYSEPVVEINVEYELDISQIPALHELSVYEALVSKRLIPIDLQIGIDFTEECNSIANVDITAVSFDEFFNNFLKDYLFKQTDYKGLLVYTTLNQIKEYENLSSLIDFDIKNWLINYAGYLFKQKFFNQNLNVLQTSAPVIEIDFTNGRDLFTKDFTADVRLSLVDNIANILSDSEYEFVLLDKYQTSDYESLKDLLRSVKALRDFYNSLSDFTDSMLLLSDLIVSLTFDNTTGEITDLTLANDTVSDTTAVNVCLVIKDIPVAKVFFSYSPAYNIEADRITAVVSSLFDDTTITFQNLDSFIQYVISDIESYPNKLKLVQIENLKLYKRIDLQYQKELYFDSLQKVLAYTLMHNSDFGLLYGLLQSNDNVRLNIKILDSYLKPKRNELDYVLII